MTNFTVRRLALATTALALTGVPGAPANAALCTWSGGAGDWGNAAMWSCGSAPGSGDSVRIDGNVNITSAVSITGTQYAGNVTLDSGDSLSISNAALYLYSSAFANGGAVTLGSGANLIGASGSTIFSGNGTIALNGANFYSQNGTQMTLGSGQNVSGFGNIGSDQGVLINNGTINASVSGQTLTLDAQGGNGGINGNGVGTGNNSAFLNTGLLEATNGSTLNFNQGLYENQGGGAIVASGAGSSVVLGNDVRIIGGTITGSGGGAIVANYGTQYLQGVTLAGGTTLGITNDGVRIDNSLANNGTITIGAGGYLIGETATTALTGTGTILLSSNAYLYNFNGTQMTIGSGQIVQGTGYIGSDQGVLINNGTINANVGGQTLTLDAQGGNGGINGNGVGTGNNSAFLNTGLLEATSGSTLNFNQGLYENHGGGAIVASGAGSSVVLGNDVRIIGGTITGSGGGAIVANYGTQYLQGVTLGSGTPLSITNDSVRIDNSLANNGTIAIGPNGYLIGENATTALTGTGTILLGSTAAGGAYLYNFNGTQMTIGSGQIVQGTGYIGVNQGVLINNGTINANVSGKSLTLDAQGGNGGIGAGNGVGTNGASAFLNNALIEATGGGALTFVQGLYENGATGRIVADGSGSQITLGNDVRIIGGTLTGSNGGTFIANYGNQYLQDVTLGSGTPLSITNDGVQIDNTLTNNGTITIGAGGYLRGETASSTIAGNGMILLNDPNSYLYNYNGTQMTIGSGQIVQGTGYIGVNQGVLINNGTINANVSGQSLTLDAQGGSGGIGAGNGVGTNGASAFLNNALIEATGGGALTFVQGLYENGANGRIVADGGGSQITLGNDARIIGGTLTGSNGGTFIANYGNQYLQDVTLGSGTPVSIVNDAVQIDNTLTNNGTITIGAGGYLRGETAASTIAGNGTILLNDPNSYLYDYNGTQMTIGSGQIVRGTGTIGADQGLITNAGNILADGAITIDAQGGGGGLGGAGLGTGGNAGFYNAAGGQVQANNGGATLTLNQGMYEQAAGASFSVGTGSNFVMGNDSNLANLQSGGVLDNGNYFAFANGTMSLRSYQTGAITTIGTNAAGTDTSVFLSGTGSVISVMPSGGGTATTIDQSLNTIAASGALVLSDGRAFTASNGAFSNAGTLRLNTGASFTAPSGFTNSGIATGNGTIGTPITNSGTVIADGGTLYAMAITGATGTIQSNAGGTLDLSGAGGASTAAYLANNGTLALGSNSITVTSDYTNAGFGSGNAFNAHGNVTGSGLILAASATQDLSGPGLSGSTLNVGNVRLGGSSSTTLTITNNGTLTTLRGAVQSPLTNNVSISSSNFVVGPNGGSTTVTLSYTGATAGSLAGNTITVANNFDNVADRTLTITGAAYNPAAASILPASIDLGATRVGGTLAGSVTIANTAPTGAYSEKLAVTAATGSGGASGTAPGGLIDPGASATSAISLGTGTAGNYSGSVTYGLATDGTGTSGLAQAVLASQTVTVEGRVYQAANAQLGTTTVNFGTVRQGAAAPTATVAVTNTANGALTDNLNTTIATLPTGVTGTAPAALAGGASGNLSFTQSTATAGQYSGTGTLDFTSTNAEMTPLALGSKSIAFSGTVTELATAALSKGSGAGTFAGGGNSFTLDLGSIVAGNGSLTTGFDILNGNSGQSYSELLGGLFSLSGGAGYSFSGSVAGLAGGDTDTNNWLTFNYSGLAAGLYSDTLTFNGYSRYAGLGDYALGPITVNIKALVTGGGGGTPPGAVPEPTTWTMLILGFGAIGGAMRRRRRSAAAQSL